MSDVTFDAADLAATLNEFEVRITLSSTISLPQGSLPTARIETKQNGRWKQAGPLILPPQGEGRADLLRLLAGLVEQPAEERAS